MLVLEKRDLAAPHRFFTHALGHTPRPAEVTTGRAASYPRVLDHFAQRTSAPTLPSGISAMPYQEWVGVLPRQRV